MTRIERLEQLRDPCVEGIEGEEGLVTQPGEDPALGDEHARLDFGFIPGFSGPCRDDDTAVVLGKFRVRALPPGFVAARSPHAALELIGNPHRRRPPEEAQRPHVARDPIRGRLSPGGLRVGVVGRPEHRDEQLHLGGLAAVRLHDRGAVPAVLGALADRPLDEVDAHAALVQLLDQDMLMHVVPGQPIWAVDEHDINHPVSGRVAQGIRGVSMKMREVPPEMGLLPIEWMEFQG